MASGLFGSELFGIGNPFYLAIGLLLWNTMLKCQRPYENFRERLQLAGRVVRRIESVYK